MGASVDFHTHILPCMDDGSDSLEISLEMLALEKEQNIDTVVLTPHFYPDNERPEQFLERRAKSQNCLFDAVKNGNYPKLMNGAEIRFFEGISDCEYLPLFAISGTKYVMIEMPMAKWSRRMLDELYDISQKQGLIPIIAHIDRYIGGINVCADIKKIAELPVFIQASADFFVNRRTRRKALKMLEGGYIHLLGSDAHNMNTRRPNMEDAISIIERALGNQAISYINSFENRVLECENFFDVT